MNRLFLIILTFSIFAISCTGQKVSNLKTERVFLDETDTTKNCYTIIYPPKLPWKGYIFIIPGFGETTENVLQQTDLPKELAVNGFLTIIPTFQDGVLSFGVDSLSQQTFDRILKDVASKHKLIDQNFMLADFQLVVVVRLNMPKTQKLNPQQFLRLTHHSTLKDFIILPKEILDFQKTTKPIKRVFI